MIDPRIRDTIAAFGFTEEQIDVYVLLLEKPLTLEEVSDKLGFGAAELLQSLLDKEIIVKKEDKYRSVPFEDVFVDVQKK